MTRIFYFSGRAKNLLPTLDYHMNINIPKVATPNEVTTCHDQNHFINVLLEGQCPTCKGRGYFSIKAV